MTEDEYIVIKAEMEDYHDDSTLQIQQWGKKLFDTAKGKKFARV